MPRHYVDDEVLSQSLSRWAIAAREADASGVEHPPVPDQIARDLITVAHRVSRKSYAGHPLREDLESFAVLHALTVLHMYDPDAGSAFSWLTTILVRSFGRYVREESAAQFRALAYARERHPTDSTVRKALADPRTQDHIARHEARLTKAREAMRTKRAATPPQPRKARRGTLLMPDGECITPNELASRLGVVAHRIYRRLKAGKSVEQILDEFQRPS